MGNTLKANMATLNDFLAERDSAGARCFQRNIYTEQGKAAAAKLAKFVKG